MNIVQRQIHLMVSYVLQPQAVYINEAAAFAAK